MSVDWFCVLLSCMILQLEPKQRQLADGQFFPPWWQTELSEQPRRKDVSFIDSTPSTRFGIHSNQNKKISHEDYWFAKEFRFSFHYASFHLKMSTCIFKACSWVAWSMILVSVYWFICWVCTVSDAQEALHSCLWRYLGWH